MNIRHLKIFITVADCGKMCMAAKELFISQPSVSQAIKELEDYYDIKLFERLSRKLYITESGTMLLKYARHIVQSFDEMEVNLGKMSENVTLRIGATITVGTCILQPIINKFEEKEQNVFTKVEINNTNIIENMLLHSQLDVGILEGKVSNPDFTKIPIYKDKLVTVVGKNHPFYNKDFIELNDLMGQDLICREEGSGGRELFNTVLEENNISMNIKWSCTTTEAIKSAAIWGQGIAVLSKLLVEEEVKNKTLHIIPIKDVDIYRDICVVFHKDKFLSKNLELFIKCAETFVEYNM